MCHLTLFLVQISSVITFIFSNNCAFGYIAFPNTSLSLNCPFVRYLQKPSPQIDNSGITISPIPILVSKAPADPINIAFLHDVHPKANAISPTNGAPRPVLIYVKLSPSILIFHTLQCSPSKAISILSAKQGKISGLHHGVITTYSFISSGSHLKTCKQISSGLDPKVLFPRSKD